jgi:OOP family OmpA-OmpF porin
VHVLDADRSKDAFNYKFGAGLQYDYTTHIGLRLEAERYRIDDAVGNKGDIDLFSLGLVYRFFGDAPVPVVAVAALPPPAPVVMPPPPPPPLPTVVKLRLSADALFDFDKAVVKPDGQRALDKLVTDLKGATVDGITVTGHTDRLGTHAYNQRLSERRAEAVKDYLVNPGALPADRISVQGIDGSEPVTRPGECVGERETPELIRCLQPDRRVEIEIKATR